MASVVGWRMSNKSDTLRTGRDSNPGAGTPRSAVGRIQDAERRQNSARRLDSTRQLRSIRELLGIEYNGDAPKTIEGLLEDYVDGGEDSLDIIRSVRSGI